MVAQKQDGNNRRFWQRSTYKVRVGCLNCDKIFKFKTPIGIDIGEANLPHGLYLHNKEGYYTLEGKKASHAHYIKCVRCGSKNIRKLI